MRAYALAFALALPLLNGSPARAQVVLGNPEWQVFEGVKAIFTKINIAGRVLQSCPTPIPTNRLQVQLFYVPSDVAKRDRAAKTPVTSFELTDGAFKGVRELPAGEYRFQVINQRDGAKVADQPLTIGTKDLNVDLILQCPKA